MAALPSPRTRQQSRQQTSAALIVAAREAFTRDGYHGANLDLIAREAGFSKGAVYSNFDGKAALFLAVMDSNMEAALAAGAWNVSEQPDEPDEPDEGRYGSDEVVAAIRGFALATLEFIATAARDEALAVELGKRMQQLTDAYAAVAEQSRQEDEGLTANEVGALLTALDQGSALLTLSGSVAIDQRVLRVGMQRLLAPNTAGMPADGDVASGTALHDPVIQQRLAAAIKDQISSQSDD